MANVSIRDLIKAGFHFGHQTSRWNPKMAPYIFKRRNLIHIIDLRETLRGLITGRKLTEAVAAKAQDVLFVGTKKQAKGIVAEEAQRVGMPYVAERWPGGLLTNYTTIRSRLERLRELESLEQTGEIGLYNKKMVSSFRREKRKILRNLGGVRGMNGLPGLLVIVDPAREHLAVREAIKLDIPIIALTDTDGDPDELDVVVPGNDDSIGAIEIFVRLMAAGAKAGLASRGIVPEAPPQVEEREEESAPVHPPEAAEPAAEAETAEEALTSEPEAQEEEEAEPADDAPETEDVEADAEPAQEETVE